MVFFMGILCNKRPMGHIAHLRKKFKSIKTYDYIIMLIQRRKKNHLGDENLLVLHLKKLESPSLKDALCQDWLKLAHCFWRRGFFNFINVFLLFLNYLPLKKGWALLLNKHKFPSPKDDLCQFWLKLAERFWRRRFLNFINVFSLFCNYLPLEKVRAFHQNKIEFPSPKDALCQVWQKLAWWFWRIFFLILSYCCIFTIS